jgi:hypothetical protein
VPQPLDRLRAILLLRGALALFFLALGVVLVATDNVVFGVFAIAVAIVNATLIAVIVRKARGTG